MNVHDANSILGVPEEVVQRAADILEMVKTRRPIYRFVNQTLSAKDHQYQVIFC